MIRSRTCSGLSSFFICSLALSGSRWFNAHCPWPLCLAARAGAASVVAMAFLTTRRGAGRPKRVRTRAAYDRAPADEQGRGRSAGLTRHRRDTAEVDVTTLDQRDPDGGHTARVQRGVAGENLHKPGSRLP